MARGAFWRVGVSGLLAALVGGPPAVAKADDEGGKHIARAFRMAMGGSRLGVSLADVAGEDRTRLKLSDERGALVKEVHADTPAAKAGLKSDDVIVRFDGETVRSSAQLSRLVRETPPGRTVAIEVSRGGAIQRLTATLEEARGFGRLAELDDLNVELPPVPPMPAMPPVPPIEPLLREKLDRPQWNLLIDRPGRLGIRYQELNDQLARHFNVDTGSILVSHVDADSPASQAGLKAGDIIVKVDGRAVSRGQDLREQVARADSGAQITLGVLRDGKPLDVTVTLAARERSRAKREPTI
jgi:C-terminal processing protease CtpA/Prc